MDSLRFTQVAIHFNKDRKCSLKRFVINISCVGYTTLLPLEHTNNYTITIMIKGVKLA